MRKGFADRHPGDAMALGPFFPRGAASGIGGARGPHFGVDKYKRALAATYFIGAVYGAAAPSRARRACEHTAARPWYGRRSRVLVLGTGAHVQAADGPRMRSAGSHAVYKNTASVTDGIRVERSLLPHAGRRFNPEGEAAPWHKGASCTSRRAPSAGSPRRRVH